MGKQSLYFECNTGISGDMVVAALIDLGVDQEKLKTALNSLSLEGYSISVTDVERNGIRCCDFDVILDQDNHDHDMQYLYGHEHAHEHTHSHEEHEHSHKHTPSHDESAHSHDHEEHPHAAHHGHPGHHHEHRHLSDIRNIIQGSGISEAAKATALNIFDILAAAEAKAHGTSSEHVHFHEVGAVDSIVDIVAAAVCLDELGIRDVIIPCICEGKGTVRCQHGILPVPVPAVVNIAEAHSLPLHIMDRRGEFITPTGAAIAAAIQTGNQLPDSFRILKTGLGSGKRSYDPPSIVRIMMIEQEEQK